MFYYEIVLGARTRSTSDSFTYSFDKDLAIGSFVAVDFRDKNISGIIVKKVTKPDFETKPVTTVLALSPLPSTQLELLMYLLKTHPYAAHAICQLFMPPSTKIYAEKPKKQQQKGSFPVLPPLNDEQTAALNVVKKGAGSLMLFGETGSGKTRIYIHAARAALMAGKSIVILAPEIGLSGFLYQQLREFLPNTYLYHSTLGKKQRQIIWQTCAVAEEPVVIIGPRSALTLPIQNIGLIIIDEAHDGSYKQDSSPYLRAHEIGSKLAQLSAARYVYATATPSATDYYYADLKKAPIVRLTGSAANPNSVYGHNVYVIAYDSATEFNSNSLIAKSALEAMKSSVKKGHQTLVLLNKRGTAHYIHCTACTWELTCPTCDRGLVYHRDTHRAHCHTCGTKVGMPSSCPLCHAEITLASPGTKAVAELIEKLIPGISLARFDTDTPKNEDITARLSELQSGLVSCIVGTQMVAKGLDLPLLETVVVLHAEGSSGGDYAAEERAFQLLHQVIGRGTRGHRDTKIYLQSHNPAHVTLKYALDRDVPGFLSHDLSERKLFGYPPYGFMAVVHYKRKSSEGAKKAGHDFSAKFQDIHTKVRIFEPLPNVRERQGPFYHWHIIVKSRSKEALVELASAAGSSWSFDLDPNSTP